MDEHLFMVEKPCPVCGKSTRLLKTRSRLFAVKTDEDFCVHYKNFNPYYYKIWMCEHCGYSTDEKTFLTKLPEPQREKLWEFVSQKNLAVEFNEERGLPEAVASYELALRFLDVIGAPASKHGAFNLQLAWIYRDAGESYAEQEKEQMIKAAEYYDEAIMMERFPIGNLTDNAAMYLVGAIYYRIGDIDKCSQHLSRIIGDQSIRTREPQVYEKARNLWSDVREQQAAKKKADAAAAAAAKK